jgi:hypothetical protein
MLVFDLVINRSYQLTYFEFQIYNQH